MIYFSCHLPSVADSAGDNLAFEGSKDDESKFDLKRSATRILDKGQGISTIYVHNAGTVANEAVRGGEDVKDANT